MSPYPDQVIEYMRLPEPSPERPLNSDGYDIHTAETLVGDGRYTCSYHTGELVAYIRRLTHE